MAHVGGKGERSEYFGPGAAAFVKKWGLDWCRQARPGYEAFQELRQEAQLEVAHPFVAKITEKYPEMKSPSDLYEYDIET